MKLGGVLCVISHSEWILMEIVWIAMWDTSPDIERQGPLPPELVP